MNGIIVYQSKTGFTKKYAEWIQEATKFDIINCEDITGDSFSTCDLVVYGSRIHAGKLDGFKKIKKLLPNNVKVVVFATGGTPATEEHTINLMWESSFTKDELRTIPHFYMQSGLNYEMMPLGDKLIMKALAKMLGNKKNKSASESGCEQAIGHSYNAMEKEYISPLIKYLETFRQTFIIGTEKVGC